MLADFFTAIRLPLAVAFPLVGGGWRLVVLTLAAGSDLLDGWLARRINEILVLFPLRFSLPDYFTSEDPRK